MATLLVALVLTGCSPSDCVQDCSQGDGGSAAEEEDTAAMVYSTEDPDPVWNADEVGTVITTLTAFGAPNPVDIANDFADILAVGDGACPADPYSLQHTPCTSESGYYYQGVGWLYVAETMDLAGRAVPSTWFHGGDFEILRPDGSRLAGGGDLKYFSEFDETQSVTSFIVAGTWDDSARDDWLGAPFSGVYTGEIVHQEGAWSFTVNGGIGVGDVDSQFVDVVWDSASACEGAPTGMIQVRDARGYWYAWDLGDDCDACGEVIFHQDQDLGELCLDLKDWGGGMAYLSSPR